MVQEWCKIFDTERLFGAGLSRMQGWGVASPSTSRARPRIRCFMSRKPFARPFQKWVAKVVKEIRLTGKYEMEQRLTEAAQEHQLALDAARLQKTVARRARPTPRG